MCSTVRPLRIMWLYRLLPFLMMVVISFVLELGQRAEFRVRLMLVCSLLSPTLSLNSVPTLAMGPAPDAEAPTTSSISHLSR